MTDCCSLYSGGGICTNTCSTFTKKEMCTNKGCRWSSPFGCGPPESDPCQTILNRDSCDASTNNCGWTTGCPATPMDCYKNNKVCGWRPSQRNPGATPPCKEDPSSDACYLHRCRACGNNKKPRDNSHCDCGSDADPTYDPFHPSKLIGPYCDTSPGDRKCLNSCMSCIQHGKMAVYDKTTKSWTCAKDCSIPKDPSKHKYSTSDACCIDQCGYPPAFASACAKADDTETGYFCGPRLTVCKGEIPKNNHGLVPDCNYNPVYSLQSSCDSAGLCTPLGDFNGSCVPKSSMPAGCNALSCEQGTSPSQTMCAESGCCDWRRHEKFRRLPKYDP